MNRKSCIFATNNKVKTMNTDLLQKRELALKKFKASKERKKHPITLAIYFKLSSVICHWREGGSLHHPQINLPIRLLGGGDDGEDTLQGRLAVR